LFFFNSRVLDDIGSAPIAFLVLFPLVFNIIKDIEHTLNVVCYTFILLKGQFIIHHCIKSHCAIYSSKT
jgi:hypothetical protein